MATPLTPEEERELRQDIIDQGHAAHSIYGEDVLRLLATLDAARGVTPAAPVWNPQRCHCRGAGSLYRSEHSFGCAAHEPDSGAK